MPYYYFLEVTLCWSIFYGFYYLLLRNETFFKWNRAYLLATLITGLLLPLIEISTVLPIVPTTVWLPEIYVNDTVSLTEGIGNNSNFSSINWLLLFYMMGGILALLQLFFALKRICFFIKTGEREVYQDYQLIHLSTITAPFSFDRWLFINKKLVNDELELQQTIQHERAHIQQRHTWDIILTEVIRIAFWWCPLIYFYKNSLRTVHEYLADAVVLQQANKKLYGQFLLRHLQPLPTYSIVNHFHSQIKSRIVMITKTPSKKSQQMKYLLFIPIFATLAFFTACEKESINYDAGRIQQEFTQLAKANNGEVNATVEADLVRLKELHPEHQAELQSIFDRAFQVSDDTFDNSIVYKEVDKMPLFTACEDKLEEERKKCADQAMLMFIYSNIKYPEAARQAQIEGTVVIKFVVDKSGRTRDAEILREVHPALAQAVMQVYEKMEAEHTWIPGRKDGEAVNVVFNLPVKFKLQ